MEQIILFIYQVSQMQIIIYNGNLVKIRKVMQYNVVSHKIQIQCGIKRSALNEMTYTVTLLL